MVDEAAVLKIAERRIIISGYVEYRDFRELRPLKEPGGHWLFSVKRILLAHGYGCHEARNKDKWRGKCGYPQSRTHFHRH